MSKHLVIGLGGTGLTMARALRCIISEELVVKDGLFYSPDNDNPHDVDIRYLEVDSSSRDLYERPFKGSSPAVGPSLLLGDNYQLNLKGKAAEGAEQSRPQGAVLFSRLAPEFDSKVKRILAELGASNDVSIHVCAGLGGGTGSGAIVDVVSRLRQLFPHQGDEPSDAKIYLYVFLPPPNCLGVNEAFEPNGYAALAELSSLNTRQWTPNDRNPGLDSVRQYRFESAKPITGILHPVFNSCYVFEKATENGDDLEVKADCSDPMANQVGQLVGYFIFLKLFSWPQASQSSKDAKNSLISSLERADKGENLGFFQFEYSYDMDLESPEMKTSDNALQAAQRYAIHSKSFQAIGLKRLIVPTLEMKRHWAAVLANEVLLHLRYDDLRDSGYYDMEPESATPEEKEEYQKKRNKEIDSIAKAGEKKGGYTKKLALKQILNEWNLDDKTLKFESSLSDQNPESDVMEIDTKWKSVTDFLISRIKQSGPCKDWCRLLDQSMRNIFDSSYQQRPHTTALGVKDFYASAVSEIDKRTQLHIDLWEEKMARDFIVGTSVDDDIKSLRMLDIYASALSQIITDKEKGRLATQRNNLVRQQAETKRLQDETEFLKTEYEKIGPVGRLIFGENRFTDYAKKVQDLYISRTEEVALDYAIKYLEELHRKNIPLQNMITNILFKFDNTLRGKRDEKGKLVSDGIQSIMRSHCPEDYNVDTALRKHICVKLYNPDRIRQISEKFTGDKELRKACLEKIKAGLLDQIRQGSSVNTLTLHDISRYFGSPSFREYVMSLCSELINTDPRFTASLDFNINQEISRRFRGQDQDKLGNIIKNTASYAIRVSRDEFHDKKFNNDPAVDRMIETTAIFFPEARQEQTADLKAKLSNHYGSQSIGTVSSQTELSIIRIKTGLPIRVFSRVRELFSKYKLFHQDHSDSHVIGLIGVHSNKAALPCFPQFFPQEDEILRNYRGTDQDYISQEKNITDNQGYGSLYKRYLLGLVQENPDTVTGVIYWCTPSTDHHDIQRKLTEKRHDLFFIEDFLSAVKESVSKACQDTAEKELTPFTMRHLYKEMKETEKKWLELTTPAYLTPEIVAKRQQALMRLDEATQAVKDRYPDPGGREYIHMVSIQAYYARQLGRNS